jgi:RimJ/RimL family protein N-acetyltransferase
MSQSSPEIVLRTARLDLRPHQPSDVPFMMALNADPEVVRYTGDAAFASAAEAEEIVDQLRRQYRESRTGRLLVTERASGEPVGWCGLKIQPDNEVNLGYRLARASWGKGIATEASRACLEHGFGALGLARVVATAATANRASIAVLTRLGFHPTGEREEHGMAVRDFALLAEEFRQIPWRISP